MLDPSTDLRPEHDIAPASWIAPRLPASAFGSVTGTVPAGFEAYARILHPVRLTRDAHVTWASVAAGTGRHIHPLVQWHALLGSTDLSNATHPAWSGHTPEVGNLEPHTLRTLCSVLARHTAASESCWFCLWDGYGWVHGGGAVVTVTISSVPGADADVTRPGPAFDKEQLDGPRVELPFRNYLLFSGPVFGALSMGHAITPDWFDPQSPNLFWPDDRTWCVGTEIDFDSTLVGGSSALIEEILATEGLEAWPIGPRDSLAFDADHLNVVQ